MRRTFTIVPVLSLPALLSVALGCGSAEPSQSKAPVESKPPTQAPKPRDDTPMEQIKGVWRMDLAQVPDSALRPEFRELKARGAADRVQIEYTITDNELFLVKSGEGGRMERHWYYEILHQVDNRMELEQEDPSGKKEKLAVTVLPDRLILGTGRGQVPLTRKR